MKGVKCAKCKKKSPYFFDWATTMFPDRQYEKLTQKEIDNYLCCKCSKEEE